MTNEAVERKGRALPGAFAPARAALEPTAGGVLTTLLAHLARRHRLAAIGLAAISCYVAIGVVMVGLGLLVTHVFAHDAVGSWDHHVSRLFYARRNPFGNRVSGDLTDIANTVEIAAAAVVLTVVLLIRHWGRHALFFVAALGVELSVFLTANLIIRRPRPPVPHLGGTPSTYSFPSGHTAATVVLYGGGALLVWMSSNRRLARLVATALAAALTVTVALSRVYRGEHYPTDVLAGLLLGVSSLAAAVFIIRVAGSRRTAPSSIPATPLPTSPLAGDPRLE